MACSVLLIGGSLRCNSVNAAVLHTASALAPPGVETRFFKAMGNLPHFNPDNDRLPLDRFVAELREQIERCDAILFSTPEYAGALPGAFKNLLDWTVGDVGINRKPVAWINASSPAAPTGGEDAHASLRKVLGYIDAHIVEAACVRIAMSRQDVGPNGIIGKSSIRAKIVSCLSDLADSAGKKEAS